MKNNLIENSNPALISIIKNFENSGQILVEGSRNKIKTFPLDGIIVAVKYFKSPILFNGIVYNYFRKSKARRSYENARTLLKKGIGTPKPIAFFENHKGIFLRESYYVCENLTPDLVFKDLFGYEDKYETEKILRGIAKFTFNLHQNGIEFLDHSPGNTLIKKNENGDYEYFLVDLNRMNFHPSMSFEARMKNMCRLTASKEMIAVISNEYAKLYGCTEDKVFDSLWKLTEDFQFRFHRKESFKKKLTF